MKASQQNQTKRMLTRRQASEYLNVSEATLARWAGQRTGPVFVKLGQGATAPVRYPVEVLDEFIAAHTRAPKS
jgi:predicted DNA-binding transcriptional regulator AlpA